MQSVGDWLDSLGLGQYENTLVANGFDDMDFMVSMFFLIHYLCVLIIDMALHIDAWCMGYIIVQYFIQCCLTCVQ